MTDPVILVPPLVFEAASADDLTHMMRRGEVSVREVTQAVLERAQDVTVRLNPFSAILDNPALAAADLADAQRQRGDVLPPLWGLPVAIKDLTPMAGQPWTAGSMAFRDRIARKDALIVDRLRAAGAIVLARTTTPEFASSGFTSNAVQGVTRNPHDLERTPGGSSGGAGVAVAMGVVPFAEGSDMGGSIRIPAAWCGVVALKPSFGRVPFAYLASTFDTISHLGPLARSVAEARLFLRHVAGHHPADPFSLPGFWTEYMDDQDTLGQFLADETHSVMGHFTSREELHQRFVQWCDGQGLKAWTQLTLFKELKPRGFEPAKSNGRRGLKGLKLR